MEEPIEQRVEQRIEHHETKMDYNHHTLWLRSYALKAGGWIPKVVVVIPEEEGNGEHEIQGEATFIEREEADKQAFLMGKAWIDRKEAGDISQEEIRALIITSATLNGFGKGLISQWLRDSVDLGTLPEGNKIFGVADDVIEAEISSS